jgi:hypothetical protein
MTNLVSNTGVVATDTTGVGTARADTGAAGYGGDKAIFGYGNTGVNVSMTNLVSNTGVVALIQLVLVLQDKDQGPLVTAQIKLFLVMDILLHSYQ